MVVVLVLALTAVLGRQAIEVRIRVTEPDLLPASHPSIATDSVLRDEFGDDRRYLVVLESLDGDVTRPEARAAYRDLCRLIRADEYLARVFVDPVDRDRFRPPGATQSRRDRPGCSTGRRPTTSSAR